MNFVKLATSMIGVIAERQQSRWPQRKWQIWHRSLGVVAMTTSISQVASTVDELWAALTGDCNAIHAQR